MKKIISLILSIIMVFTAMPIVALGAEEECVHSVKEWGFYFKSGPGDGKTYDCTDSAYTIGRNGICTKCNTVIDEIIPTQPSHYLVALPRYDVDGNIIEANYKEPTCTENGYAKSVCKICNTVVSEPILTEGHTYGEAVVYSPCFADGTTTDGTYRKYCTKPGCDGYSEEKVINHRHIVYDGVEASCFGPGRTDYKICLDCGTQSQTTETEKLNHIDADGNGKCDLCLSAYLSDGVYCSCICHSTSSFMQFLLPLIRLVWQLLGVDNCHGDCNVAHYEK